MDLSSIKFIKSPNFQPRGSNVPQIIVLHCPVGTMQGCVVTFQNPNSKVSAHYVADRTGELVQMVDLSNAAWHAMHYPNMIGIGIEMVDRYLVGNYPTRGCMSDPQWFTTLQLAAVSQLVATLMQKFNIPLNKVMGHNDQWLKQFGNNHLDPGPYFPWVNFKVLVQKALTAQPQVEAEVRHEVTNNNPAYSGVSRPDCSKAPVTQPLVLELTKPRKKRGRRLIKPPKRNRIYE